MCTINSLTAQTWFISCHGSLLNAQKILFLEVVNTFELNKKITFCVRFFHSSCCSCLGTWNGGASVASKVLFNAPAAAVPGLSSSRCCRDAKTQPGTFAGFGACNETGGNTKPNFLSAATLLLLSLPFLKEMIWCCSRIPAWYAFRVFVWQWVVCAPEKQKEREAR